MANLVQVQGSLDPGPIIEMYVLDLSSIPGVTGLQRFHGGVNELNSDLVWRGEVYTRFSLKATGFDKQAKGPLPRPKLKVDNVTAAVVPLLMAYQDLVGATVIRKRTHGMFLDAVNFKGGNPTADPTQAYPDDVYFIERKSSETPTELEFELRSSLDLNGFKLPGEIISVDVCPNEYRQWRNGRFETDHNEVCNYNGTDYFDVRDQPVTDPSRDVCSKLLSGCKLRFKSQPLRFGGFPGARKYRT